MTGGGDDLVRVLADAAAPVDVRRAALESLHAQGPGVLAELRKSGRLGSPSWPSREQGRTLGGDALFVTAVCMPVDRVADVLAAADRPDPEDVVLAARIAEAAARYDRHAADVFEPLLRGWLGDRREAFPWAGSGGQTVGQTILPLHLSVVKVAAADNRPRRQECWAGAVIASLSHGRPLPPLYAVFEAWIRSGLDPAALCKVLNDALANPSLSPVARLAARESFDTVTGVLMHPDGVPSGAAEAVGAGVVAANATLVGLLRNSTTPPDLASGIAALLHRWVPEAVALLQHDGVLTVQPVPSRRAHKDWTPAGVELLSTSVSFDEVCGLLAEPSEQALDRVVTALRLAPAFASWLPSAAERLVPPVRALIASAWPVPMKSRPVPLGAMAAEIYPRLFPSVEERQPWMAAALADGIRASIDAGWDLTKAANWWAAVCTHAELAAIGDCLLAAVADTSRPLEDRRMYHAAIEINELNSHARRAAGLLRP